MKTINQYINEKFQVSKNYTHQYTYQPKNKDELIDYITYKIKKEGFGTKDNPLDLNDIDTSKITDMSKLFDAIDGPLNNLSNNGYFDISDWDVSNVKNMCYMFYVSNFDGDISDWNVSSVKNMSFMFKWSKFTGKNGDISNWDVSNVENMYEMFNNSRFNGNIDNWDVQNTKIMYAIFANCPLSKNPPEWYKYKK